MACRATLKVSEVIDKSQESIKTRSQQPHRGLHAGARPRGSRDQAQGHLRVALWAGQRQNPALRG
jgi:hypothetical protein